MALTSHIQRACPRICRLSGSTHGSRPGGARKNIPTGLSAKEEVNVADRSQQHRRLEPEEK